jgi:hypothetical protein
MATITACQYMLQYHGYVLTEAGGLWEATNNKLPSLLIHTTGHQPTDLIAWQNAVVAVEGLLGEGCPTCLHFAGFGKRCQPENLGLTPTWRTREHGVGCPRRKTRPTPEEET